MERKTWLEKITGTIDNLVHQGKYKCLRFSPNGVFYTTIAKMKSFIAEQEKYQFENKDNLEK